MAQQFILDNTHELDTEAHAASLEKSAATVDATGLYLSRIGSVSLLTASEEVMLAKRMELGAAAKVRLEEVAGDSAALDPAPVAHRLSRRSAEGFRRVNMSNRESHLGAIFGNRMAAPTFGRNAAVPCNSSKRDDACDIVTKGAHAVKIPCHEYATR